MNDEHIEYLRREFAGHVEFSPKPRRETTAAAGERNAQEVSALLADDFLEIGSSGRVFDKAAIIAELATEVSRSGTLIADFEVEMLSPVIALVRYRTIRKDAAGVKQALRSSIWVYRDGRWQLKFHQGTPAPSI